MLRNEPKIKRTLRKTSSQALVYAELLRRGYTIDETSYPSGFVGCTAPNGKTWLTNQYLLGGLSYPFVSRAVYKLCKSKTNTSELASNLGVNTPAALIMSPQSQPDGNFLSQYAPLVVKPENGHGSRGLSLGVMTTQQLMKAVQRARTYAPTILLQQQFDGQEIRFTILDGEVVSCILRSTPRLTGDGISTVGQLLAIENQARDLLDNSILQYPQLTDSLVDSNGLDMDSVSVLGEVISLGTSSLVSGGASLYGVMTQVDPTYIALAKRIADAINPAFLTVDMLIADYRCPAAAGNYVFLECNVAPSLRLYYGLRDGAVFDIIPRLADMIDRTLYNETKIA